MYKKVWTVFELNKIVSIIVIHVLDSLLFLVLLPFMVWEWISERPYIITIVRTVVEVTLELIMWIIFAGMAILTTVICIFDDVYCSKTHYDNNQQKYLYVTEQDNNDQNSHIIKSPNFEKEKR
ncbi:uncharacterized protein LOC112455136 [Temnothorax curvispinosus]|uniref:Uncharacterized protein LOC112455136 n=1 Tax=Temnothorax curvispinosus TaxID=300111 RepID=A0A6J1PTL4_9HYME|nr:uncharacterized protein LOC112455136 [Temnothorax curvispinosus]